MRLVGWLLSVGQLIWRADKILTKLSSLLCIKWIGVIVTDGLTLLKIDR